MKYDPEKGFHSRTDTQIAARAGSCNKTVVSAAQFLELKRFLPIFNNNNSYCDVLCEPNDK